MLSFLLQRWFKPFYHAAFQVFLLYKRHIRFFLETSQKIDKIRSHDQIKCTNKIPNIYELTKTIKLQFAPS